MNRIGLDMGLSTTDAVCSWDEAACATMQTSGDPLASARAAIVGLLACAPQPQGAVSITATGVGASRLAETFENRPVQIVSEFEAIGLGGTRVAGLDEALVVSLGTGTAFVSVRQGRCTAVTPGTGVGGGTLAGFSRLLFGSTDLDRLVASAARGARARLDYTIGEVTGGALGGLPESATASNLGKTDPSPRLDDQAAALTNLVFEVTFSMMMMAMQLTQQESIVLVGKLPLFSVFRSRLEEVPAEARSRLVIPARGAVATAIGTLPAPGDHR